MSNRQSVDDLPAEFERLVAARDELWLRHERAIADAKRLAEYAGSLGPKTKPAALPAIADLNLLSSAAREAVDGLHAEATQIATMHDEIQQRRSRIVDLRQQADSARTMRNVLIAAVVVLVLILFLFAVTR
jgi:hypothetical protein